jgi:excisionase family DNA binding protein
VVLGGSASGDAVSTVVVMSAEELQKLVRETWSEARKAHVPKEVLTVSEAAELLDLNPKTVLKYINEHALPAHRMGTEWRFRRSEILEWLDGRKGR